MGGPRISIIVHDGNRVVDQRAIRSELFNQTILDSTKTIYGTSVETKAYSGLGEGVTAFGNLKQEANAGWQIYLATVVDGKVVQMGLPFIPDKSGKQQFLGSDQLTLEDVDSYLKTMLPGIEVALVWRYDRGYTQDLTFSDSSTSFSLSSNYPQSGSRVDSDSITKEPEGGCGSDNAKIIMDPVSILKVGSWTGDGDNKVSFISDSLHPQEVYSDSFVYIPPPLVLTQLTTPNQQPNPVPSSPNTVSGKDALAIVSGLWVDSEKSRDDKWDATFSYVVQQTPPSIQSSSHSKQMVIVVSTTQAPVFDGIKQEESMIVRLIMNPTERKLWGKLYGFPDEDQPSFTPKSILSPAIVPTLSSSRPAIPVQHSFAVMSEGLLAVSASKLASLDAKACYPTPCQPFHVPVLKPEKQSKPVKIREPEKPKQTEPEIHPKQVKTRKVAPTDIPIHPVNPKSKSPVHSSETITKPKKVQEPSVQTRPNKVVVKITDEPKHDPKTRATPADVPKQQKPEVEPVKKQGPKQIPVNAMIKPEKPKTVPNEIKPEKYTKPKLQEVVAPKPVPNSDRKSATKPLPEQKRRKTDRFMMDMLGVLKNKKRTNGRAVARN
ncbi:Uncharacterised protein [Candidatus Bilamarchaeum dharawalense]|uniref:Uncharacterized protein n=1 Tax=Candidatus Bilamarchaeum dharawalense TaxID=2885759 RepID=A0A5E4LVI7_9ARCH|nr:Uncharacterised protein [Candidatus Bilamarchaeum dharawalense]